MARFAQAALGVAVGCTALVGFGAGTAHAAPYSCTAQQMLSTEVAHPGEIVTDELTCFGPNSEITGLFFSFPKLLFKVQADANGSATATFRVPHSCGEHTVVAKDDVGNRVASPLRVVGCGHRHHHHGPCEDWRDPGYWIKHCDTEDHGWDSGFDAAYTAPMQPRHSSNSTVAGVTGLALLAPALLGGGVLIARRRGR